MAVAGGALVAGIVGVCVAVGTIADALAVMVAVAVNTSLGWRLMAAVGWRDDSGGASTGGVGVAVAAIVAVPLTAGAAVVALSALVGVSVGAAVAVAVGEGQSGSVGASAFQVQVVVRGATG